MPIIYGLLGLLGLVLLLVLLILFVPVYVRLVYDGELCLAVRILGIPLTVLPTQDKPKEPKPKKSPRASGKKPSKVQEFKTMLTTSFREDGVAATVSYLGELARLAGSAVGDALRAITVDKLHLDMLIATGDAGDTAVRYGQVCSALYPALAAISLKVRVRRQELRVEPNFLLEKSAAYADVRLRVSVYRVVGAGLKFLVKYFMLNATDIKEETKDG